MKDLEKLLCKLLLVQLKSIGLFKLNENVLTEFKAEMNFQDMYSRWLDESIRILDSNQYVRYNSASSTVTNLLIEERENAWEEWEQQKEGWLKDPNMTAQVVLVDTTLRALPKILLGKVRATDIIFPNSSMELVEGIYKNNPVADYFNDILASCVFTYIQERVRLDSSTQIRILEIGAGTGSTSARVFQKLQPYQKYIKEYCYTDVSKAFLMHAEEEYGTNVPYLTYELLNIEVPIADQNIRVGKYDIVIAANVLHATKNIRKVLRNTKAVLKKKGTILLNEMSENSLFTHLTFGLLEGWWLYEDSEFRIPGGPGLTPNSWKKALESEGYRSVLFPAQDAHGLGQQIIIAESDGIVRQKQELNSYPTITNPIKEPSLDNDCVTIQGEITQDVLKEEATVFIKNLVGKTLKIPSQKINSRDPLEKYGVDSILIVKMTNALRNSFKNISSTVFFEYRSIDELVDYLISTEKDSLSMLLEIEDQKISDIVPNNPNKSIISHQNPESQKSNRFLQFSRQKSEELQTQNSSIQDVAIIGLSGRYPEADDIYEFWGNLKRGENCITEIPNDRWNWEEYFNKEKGKRGSIYTKWGGFVKDIDKFDPLFFHIAPREAELMDPQERLFLQEAHSSIEDAGYTPASLCNSGKVGVFVGVMNGYYPSGSNFWSIANRVSYLLDFQGPSIAVDTACSSSLTAIHLALESIYTGTSDCAIVGGVNLIVSPAHYLRLSAATMLSTSNECKSFGDQADGFVDGEGIGAIVLKPLQKAIADNDHIYGVIKGSMINSGGKTNGYTVPNPNAQCELVTEALKRANVHPRTISYVEAHGTGTSLGDPIEITGLTKAFQKETKDSQFCAIGSVKSNIGHCESAAGIVGLTKVLLQLKYGQLVPSLHSKILNSHIDFDNSPFIVQQELTDWKRPIVNINGELREYPRIASISSFGAGGANAHLIVTEYTHNESLKQQSVIGDSCTPAVIVLSAKNKDRLKAYAKNVMRFLENSYQEEQRKSLQEIAYTLQVGREAFEERLALVVFNLKELIDKLHLYCDEKNHIDKTYYGNVSESKNQLDFLSGKTGQEFIKLAIREQDFHTIASLWVTGVNVQWELLYTHQKPKRVSLPTYPFEKKRYWITEAFESPLEDRSRVDVRLGEFLETIPSEIKTIDNEIMSFLNRTDSNGDFVSMQKFLSAMTQLEEMSHYMLLNVFQRIGVFHEAGEQYSKFQLRDKLQISPYYQKLFETLLSITEKAGFIRFENDIIFTTNKMTSNEVRENIANLEEKVSRLIEAYPEIEDYALLLKNCFENYHSILTAKKDYKEVMFSNGSGELLKNIFNGNLIAKYYERLTGRLITSYVKQRISKDPGAKIIILEIGSVYGAPSRFVLDNTKEYHQNLSYIFANSSNEVAAWQKQQYEKDYPHFSYKELNIENSLEKQDFKVNDIDLVFANHTLFATKNISTTLNQIKRLLKTNGLLFINEITQIKDFITMIFGLASPWWDSDDEDNRLNGSPLLSFTRWRQLLEEVGYRRVRIAGPIGVDTTFQTVLIGESDGQVLVKDHSSLKNGSEQICQENTNVVALESDEPKNTFESMIADIWKEVLGVEQLSVDDNFQKVGGDSIMTTQIISRVKSNFPFELNLERLFGVSTIAEMAEILEQELIDKIEDLPEEFIKEQLDIY
ncbi:beta-ketoacyl synthase N-terminal-like domain-containing protein [Lysinibacillus sp. NPDC092081]|uniref:beta-ketoacyl synthase N-terminal-like domain-containing protein n=1 Tax=Lysinibacillus sp. NPDC092081 TaxID=3364131 RepID=UPI0037FEC73A